MEILADRLKERRIHLGKSQLDVAMSAHSLQPHISEYERGIAAPNVRSLKRLAMALRTSTDYLLGLVDDPTPRHVGHKRR